MWSSRPKRPRRWFLRMLLLAVVLALVIGSALMYAVRLSSVRDIQVQVDSVAAWSSLIRLGLMGAVAGLWRPMVQRLHASNRLHERTMRDLLALRWRVVSWLLILELLIGQNLLGQLVAVFSGIAA